MEDGACLAVCLELAGKERVSDALRAFEKIRYDRVRKIQKTGETSEYNYSFTFEPRLTSYSSRPMAQGRLRQAQAESRDGQAQTRRVDSQSRRRSTCLQGVSRGGGFTSALDVLGLSFDIFINLCHL